MLVSTVTSTQWLTGAAVSSVGVDRQNVVVWVDETKPLWHFLCEKQL